MRIFPFPTKWGEGGFSGNGLLGFMAYLHGETAVCWELGRTDLMDRRDGAEVDCDAFRLPVGRLLLQTGGQVTGGWMEMDVDLAQVSATLETSNGSVSFTSYTHAIRPIIVVTWQGTAVPALQPAYSVPLSLAYNRPVTARLLNPPPVIMADGDRLILQQAVQEGDDYAVVVETVAPGVAYVSIERGTDGEDATRKACAILDDAKSVPPDALLAEHQEWWHRYHAVSSVELPDPFWQRFADLQVYKVACATRADRPAMDLLGPWTHPTVWSATWWNLNTQLAYLPVYAANHPELGESLLRLLRDAAPNFAANAGEWADDSAVVGRATDRDGVGVWEGEWCNLPWVCHNIWLHYRTTMDETILRDDLFPLLRRCVNYYRHLLFTGEDGLLHLPVGISPEYSRQAADTTINLALLRWGCETLGTAAKQLGIEDPLLGEWGRIVEKLAPYPVDATGLMIGADVPLSESHRHFSHLLPIYPLRMISYDDASQRELIRRSVDHWANQDAEFAGYSYIAAAVLYATLGDGDRALAQLERYRARFGTPNTMYLEHGGWGAPTLETPLFVLCALQEMLLQTHGGVIRPFPAVPAHWSNVSFLDWRSEGAFLVSAVLERGQMTTLTIKGNAGETCAVRLPSGTYRRYDGAVASSRALEEVAGEKIHTFPLMPGETSHFIRL